MKNLLFILAFTFLASNFSYCQWEKTNGLDSADVNCLAVKGDTIFAGTVGLFMSTNNGGTWTLADSVYGHIWCIAISGKNIFVGTVEIGPNGIYLSTNNGASWFVVNNGLNESIGVYSLAISGENIFAGTASTLNFSTDNGLMWNAVYVDSVVMGAVTSLAITGNNIFAGCGGGRIGPGGIFFSTNNGESWNYNGIEINPSVYSLVINGSNIFAGTEIGVYLSTNNGTSWSAVNNGLQDAISVFSFAIIGKYIFAGTGNISDDGDGIFLSSDNGENWISVGMANYEVRSLAIKGDTLFAGTLGAGVWKRSISDILGINEFSIQHSEFSIQITPNPVTQSANITYQLPQKEQITIKIFDLTGREITTLLNETKDKGDYNLIYNTSNLSRGMYFLKASTNSEIRLSKFIKE